MTAPRIIELTPMQRRVLGELARDGASNAVIAARLNVSLWTVKSHLKGVALAFGVSDRAAIVALCLRRQVAVRVVDNRGREAS